MNDNSSMNTDHASLTLEGLDVPTLTLPLVPHFAVAERPADRVRFAAAMALPTLFEAYFRAKRQRGIEPVMVIACADCESGRTLIARLFGDATCAAAAGPMCWAWSEAEAASELTAAGWEKLSNGLDKIGHVDGGMRVLFAVNGQMVAPLVFRAGDLWHGKPIDTTTTASAAA